MIAHLLQGREVGTDHLNLRGHLAGVAVTGTGAIGSLQVVPLPEALPIRDFPTVKNLVPIGMK